jgi:hypothetical protein
MGTAVTIKADWRTATAIVLSLLYLAAFAIAGGRQAFLGVLIYLVLPWSFMKYPEELGSWSYGIPVGYNPGVNRTTPGSFVYLLGWIFFFAPAIYYFIVF